LKLSAIANLPKQFFGHANSEKDVRWQTEAADCGLAEPTHMALVPAGDTMLQYTTIDEAYDEVTEKHHRVHVDSFYMDQFAVSNAEFAKFVADGGYADMKLWPKEIWPNVLQFVDQTGKPGPRYWSNGKPELRLMQHPVVGVCWFEANAFAHWTGKRLPTSSQWQRAATWASDGFSEQSRFPWSGGFDANKANIWISGKNSTVEVDEYCQGCTANGIYQLVGNVWEWVATRFAIHQSQRADLQIDSNLIEIRGGAFDTYLESQATCLFRTGQPYLFRGKNVGFRCCKEVD